MRICPVPMGCEEKQGAAAYEWCGVLQQSANHHCGDWRQSVWFIWSVWFVSFVWLNQMDRMNQVNDYLVCSTIMQDQK